LAAKQVREETTMFAPTAFSPQALVTKLRQMIVIDEPIVGVQYAIPRIVKQRATKAIRSGARHNRNPSMRDAPKLRSHEQVWIRNVHQAGCDEFGFHLNLLLLIRADRTWNYNESFTFMLHSSRTAMGFSNPLASEIATHRQI
jgi:hypothetical protein